MLLEQEAKDRIIEILDKVPVISLATEDYSALLDLTGSSRPDFFLSVQAGVDTWRLMCEVKTQIQPRQARSVVFQLKEYQKEIGDPNVYPVLLAPYISNESANICNQANVGYVDLAGNCRLAFGPIFIENTGAINHRMEKRRARSLFSPRASRIIRCLLRDPGRIWRVKDVKESANVSIGLVSNVRHQLLDREWAQVRSGGLMLTQSDALLDAWRDAYIKRTTNLARYYTMLHGESLERQIIEALSAAGLGTHALLSSYSAARWLAPFARYPYQTFYADEIGESILCDQLQLTRIGKGDNVIIERPADESLLTDRIEAAPGVWSTGLIQTYLDLHASGERGVEAAAHLRKHRIEPLWNAIS
jgi:hypothetical protein